MSYDQSKPFVDMGGGETEIGEVSSMEEGFNRSLMEKAELIDKETREQMSPKGALGLPSHLDDKRLKHGIIDSAFEVCATFNRILLWQLPVQSETFTKGGVIVTPETSKSRLKQETPRGIVISAGLEAMDILTTNGAQVGDTVLFIRQAMWRITVGHICNVPQHLIVLNVGDIVSNQDQMQRLKDGTLEYGWDPESAEHYLEDEDGRYEPKKAWVGADYD